MPTLILESTAPACTGITDQAAIANENVSIGANINKILSAPSGIIISLNIYLRPSAGT